MRALFLAPLFLAACIAPTRTGTQPGAKPEQNPTSHIELVIDNVSKSDAEALRGQLLALGEIGEVTLKSYANKTATYEFDLKGCECDLPAKMAKIRSPGLKYGGRTTKVSYQAFDNLPPVVRFVHPEDGRILSSRDQLVALEVRDSDIDEVRVGTAGNMHKAELFHGDIYLAPVNLGSDKNTLRAEARDLAGNVTVQEAVVTVVQVDPADPSLRFVVDGKTEAGSRVIVEGEEAQVEENGHYRIEIPVRKGQKQIEIISISSSGKKTVTVKQFAK
jgi:hypothetical protein